MVSGHPLAQSREHVTNKRIAMLHPAIMHPFAIATCFHQADPLQVSQVTRHFRLHHAQRIGQFADTGFARGEQVQQTQPRRIRQRFEKKRRRSIFR